MNPYIYINRIIAQMNNKQNFERITKPCREYNELYGERLNKDRKLSKRRQNGSLVKQMLQSELDD